MPATQISFAEFALAQQAAIVCPPPVQQPAIEVVAHPLPVDGGECIPFEGAVLRPLGACFSDLRADFSDSCGAYIEPDWSGAYMDAPGNVPAGSHIAVTFCVGHPFAYVKANGYRWAR